MIFPNLHTMRYVVTAFRSMLKMPEKFQTDWQLHWYAANTLRTWSRLLHCSLYHEHFSLRFYEALRTDGWSHDKPRRAMGAQLSKSQIFGNHVVVLAHHVKFTMTRFNTPWLQRRFRPLALLSKQSLKSVHLCGKCIPTLSASPC